MDDERVDEVFARLAEIDIELDYDPIERGPKFLNNMVASCRNYTTEVQRYMRECQMYIRTIERQLRTAEARYELEYNDIMSNDPDIIKMRAHSKADRESLTKMKLQDLVGEITNLEMSVTDARHVETVIDSKLRELRDINRDIRLQKRLIEDEIQTGAFWGNDQGSDTKHMDESDMDLDVGDVFEVPDEDEESEPDYGEFFVEDTEKDLDTAAQDVTIEDESDTSDQQKSLESETTAFDEESFEDLDFEAALSSLG